MKKILLLGLLCVVTACFTEKLIGMQTHTLITQGDWIYLKTGNSLHRRGLMGAGEYVLERQALAGEELNLSPWFGFNDLVYAKPLPDFTEYRVRFRLDDLKSFLWIYLDCGPAYCNAVRISRTPFYPSGMFRVDYEGQFLDRKPLPLAEKSSNTFSLRKDGAGYTFSINDESNYAVDYSLPEKTIRFLGSPEGAVVSSISVDNNNIDFKAPFNRTRFLVAFAVFAVLSSVIAAYSVLGSLLNALVLLTLVLILFSFDRFYWSRIYISSRFTPTVRSSETILAVEKFRQKIFGQPEDTMAANLPVPLAHYEMIRRWSAPDYSLSRYPQLLGANGSVKFTEDIAAAVNRNRSRSVMVAFLGGSQTWGAGASSGNLSWPSLLVQKLQKESKNKKTVSGVNFAICGAHLQDYFKWLPQIKALRPDLMIINLGVNDKDTENGKFLADLEKLQAFFDAEKIKVIYSLEALNTVMNLVGSPKNPLILQFAASRQIEVMDLHKEFHKPENFDSGLLFMDIVHFADAGQEVAAQYFAKQPVLLKLLR